MPFELIWSDASGNEIKGPDLPAGNYMFPVSFPGTTSASTQIQVRSNSSILLTYETLTNVKFYLTGSAADVTTVQQVWPNVSATQLQLNGGFEISFDFGRTYIRFDSNNGVKASPNTWVQLPAEAIGLQGSDGKLGAFDSATMFIRFVVPPSATQYKVLDIKLGVDFDII